MLYYDVRFVRITNSKKPACHANSILSNILNFGTCAHQIGIKLYSLKLNECLQHKISAHFFSFQDLPGNPSHAINALHQVARAQDSNSQCFAVSTSVAELLKKCFPAETLALSNPILRQPCSCMSF